MHSRLYVSYMVRGVATAESGSLVASFAPIRTSWLALCIIYVGDSNGEAGATRAKRPLISEVINTMKATSGSVDAHRVICLMYLFSVLIPPPY